MIRYFSVILYKFGIKTPTNSKRNRLYKGRGLFMCVCTCSTKEERAWRMRKKSLERGKLKREGVEERKIERWIERGREIEVLIEISYTFDPSMQSSLASIIINGELPDLIRTWQPSDLNLIVIVMYILCIRNLCVFYVYAIYVYFM